MKFGEYLQDHAITDWQAHYFQYDSLKAIFEETGAEFTDEVGFVTLFTGEQDRIDQFVSGKIVEMVNNLAFLETHGEDTLLADTISEDLIRLDLYVQQNLEAMRKLIKKYRKKTGLSTVWYETQRDARWLFKAAGAMHALIVQLSGIYERQLANVAVAGGATWKPPASFERTTVKYWVSQQHITALKLFIIRNLPILELTKSQRVSREFYKQELNQVPPVIFRVLGDTCTCMCLRTRREKNLLRCPRPPTHITPPDATSTEDY